MNHQRLSHEIHSLSEPERRWVRQAIAALAESDGAVDLALDALAKPPTTSENPVVAALIAGTEIGEAHKTFNSLRLFLWYRRIFAVWNTASDPVLVEHAKQLAMHLVAKLCPEAGEILFNVDQQQAETEGTEPPAPPEAEEPPTPH